jgi:hypothetical protein
LVSVVRPILFIFYFFLFSGQRLNKFDCGGPCVVLFQNCVWQPCPPFKVVRVWSPFKIVSDSPALHSRWSLLLKNGISLIYHIWFILSQINLKFILLYMTRSSSTYLHGFSIQNFCSVHLYLLCKLGLFW